MFVKIINFEENTIAIIQDNGNNLGNVIIGSNFWFTPLLHFLDTLNDYFSAITPLHNQYLQFYISGCQNNF